MGWIQYLPLAGIVVKPYRVGVDLYNIFGGMDFLFIDMPNLDMGFAQKRHL